MIITQDGPSRSASWDRGNWVSKGIERTAASSPQSKGRRRVRHGCGEGHGTGLAARPAHRARMKVMAEKHLPLSTQTPFLSFVGNARGSISKTEPSKERSSHLATIRCNRCLARGRHGLQDLLVDPATPPPRTYVGAQREQGGGRVQFS